MCNAYLRQSHINNASFPAERTRMQPIEQQQPRSLITGGPTELLFSARVLNKFNVRYYRCIETGYIQTETPYWLDEAYSSAITSLDLGLASRNCENVELTSRIIDRSFST